ncbi:hypothetical protein SDC9_102714 [bioreactor metagenome]|uniref:Uncharacterized protein n=1 Tax=bioreactor metagenome TaxID=1076179 RepID=A0A645ASN7_9ZZZZ
MHDLKRERKTLRAADVLADEVQAAFVHADKTDRIEVVRPVFPRPFLHVPQIIGRVRIQTLFGLRLDDLALDLKACLAEHGNLLQALEEILLRGCKIPQPRQIDAIYADAAGHGIAAKEAAAAFAQLALIQSEAAAHGDRVLRRKIGIHIVREIWDTIFAGDSHKIVHYGAFPVEIFGDVDGRNRECEHAPFRVALEHDLAERVVKEIHLLLKLAVGLVHHLPADESGFVLERGRHLDIECQVGKRALEPDARRNIDVKDELLQTLADLVKRHLVIIHKRCAIGIKRTPSLRAGGFALRRKCGVDDLPQKRTQMLCRLAFHLSVYAAEPIGEQLAKIPPRAIGAKKTEIMDMRVARLMRFAHVDGIDFIEPVFLRERLADIIVQPVDAALHICVFLHAPVTVVQVITEHIDRCANQGIDFARTTALFAIENIRFRGLGVSRLDEYLLHEILNALNIRRCAAIARFGKPNNLTRETLRAFLIRSVDSLRRLPDCVLYLCAVKRLPVTVALDNLLKHILYTPRSSV